jgi:hypothetical protein
MIHETSVDFVFSFDALVHADELVMMSYVSQLSRIMKDHGVAFIHHSNLGQYHNIYSIIRKVPKLESLLKRVGVLPKGLGWRDFSVDAKKVESLALQNGLACIGQEIIPWIDTRPIYLDCISTITKNSSFSRQNQKLRNSKFIEEARYLVKISRIHSLHPE